MQHGNRALAIIRLEHVLGTDPPDQLKVEVGGVQHDVIAYLPFWWPAKLPGLKIDKAATVFDAVKQ